MDVIKRIQQVSWNPRIPHRALLDLTGNLIFYFWSGCKFRVGGLVGKQAGNFKNNLIVLFVGPISSFFGRHIKSFRPCKMG